MDIRYLIFGIAMIFLNCFSLALFAITLFVSTTWASGKDDDLESGIKNRQTPHHDSQQLEKQGKTYSSGAKTLTPN